MIDWHNLDSSESIRTIISQSEEKAVLIFKHSTRCPISSMAKYRLESDWDFSQEELLPYYLDVIDSRPTSLEVAEVFHVHHESPQVLLIKKGECIFESSHLDINVKELRETYNNPA